MAIQRGRNTLTLCVHEVGQRNGVAGICLGRCCLEHGLGPRGRTNAQVLLPQLLGLLLEGEAILARGRALAAEQEFDVAPEAGQRHTSCSSSEIFFSFILWTPASAAAARAAATKATFMVGIISESDWLATCLLIQSAQRGAARIEWRGDETRGRKIGGKAGAAVAGG